MREEMDHRNMEEQRRQFVARLIQQLREADCWTGETHIQKSMFLAQEMLGCQRNYGFYIYHYGPYCRDLAETLQFMQMFGEIKTEPDSRYAPRFQLTAQGRELAKQQVDDLGAIEWVSKKVSNMTVAMLEGPTTAYFLKLQDPTRTDEQIVKELHRVKPHISFSDGFDAIALAESMRREATQAGLVNPT